jgi:hypothetical protein
MAGEGKVVLLLRHEDIWGNGDIVLQFLTTALDGVELSASHPCRVTPGEKPPAPVG